MAEQADAHRSGRCGSNPVQVRFLSAASNSPVKPLDTRGSTGFYFAVVAHTNVIFLNRKNDKNKHADNYLTPCNNRCGMRHLREDAR